jgi:hypothetical protein
MKKSLLFLTVIVFIGLLGCSSDKDNSEFPGVPSGDIVPAAQRMATLTRSSSSGRSQDRYWKFFKSEVIISGCGQSFREDLLEDYADTDVIEIKFDDDFTYQGRLNGSITNSGSWSWSNETTKDGIILDMYGDYVFKFTKLTSTEVIYATSYNESADECANIKITTYEQLRAN